MMSYDDDDDKPFSHVPFFLFLTLGALLVPFHAVVIRLTQSA